jgi:hypothetical protein
VGLSRQQTKEEDRRPKSPDSATMDPLKEVQTVTNGHSNGHMNGHANGLAYGIPFTEDEITRAMTKTSLRLSEVEKV